MSSGKVNLGGRGFADDLEKLGGVVTGGGGVRVTDDVVHFLAYSSAEAVLVF